MTISSVPTNYFKWLNDTGVMAQDVLTIDTGTMANLNAAAGGAGNVTLNSATGSSYYYNTGAGGGGFGGAGSTVVLGGGSSYTIGSGITNNGTISISTSTIDQLKGFSFQLPEEWEDSFPNWSKVQKMCEEYPGLKIAFEKFKTTYKLVIDHYDTPEDQRPLP
jgi:hypothetical protein